METGDYPSLFAVSDTAANKAKQKYYLLLIAQLTIFVMASFSGSLASRGDIFYSRVSAFLLAATLIITWINRAQHYDKSWYESRAIAESVKTLTWRYMMQTEPFPPAGDSDAAQKSFAGELQRVRKTHAHAAADLTDFTGAPTVLSHYMEKIRNADWQTRKQEYLQQRLEPERIWYEANARRASSESERWLWAVIAVQVLALFFAVVPPSWHVALFNPVTLLSMIASIITAWSQAKRHDEVAHSYASVAQILGDLQGMADIEAKDAASFANFVIKVEDAIAKERAHWLIKKNVAIDVDSEKPQSKN